MPRYIKPMNPKPVPQPSDNRLVDPAFRLDASELFMFDNFAQEPVNAAGTEGWLFQRDLKNTKADPLYSEPIVSAFVGPYLLMVQVEWPEGTPDVSELGMRTLWPSGIWIPRRTLEEARARPPSEGDVIRFWDLPYFNKVATRNQNTPGSGFYFDLIKVNDDGHLIDNAAFVGFRCDLKRRSNFTPEQQFITPPSGPGKGPNDPCE